MQRINSEAFAMKVRAGFGFLSARRAALPVAMLLVFTAFPAHAQYRTSIQGSVTDPQGSTIPGATLTLKNLSTNATTVHKSNDSGVFNFNALPADHFSLEIEREGFKKKVLNDLQLIPEQPNSLNIQLEIGDVTQTVSVNANLEPALDTQTATISRTITSNEIEQLPTFGRDVFQLSQLAPGAVADGSQAGGGGTFNLPGNQGPGGTAASAGIFQTENGPQVNANGGQYGSNGITIDGISTVSAVWGGTTVITPTEDSIDNVKVVTNSYDSENGRFSGALTQVTSKSGSNSFHGSFFFQANRPGLNAYQRYNGPSFYNSGATTPSAKGLLRDTQQFNQYGGSVGGPIWKNKIFGFFAYETIRNNSSVTGTGWYGHNAIRRIGATGQHCGNLPFVSRSGSEDYGYHRRDLRDRWTYRRRDVQSDSRSRLEYRFAAYLGPGKRRTRLGRAIQILRESAADFRTFPTLLTSRRSIPPRSQRPNTTDGQMRMLQGRTI